MVLYYHTCFPNAFQFDRILYAYSFILMTRTICTVRLIIYLYIDVQYLYLLFRISSCCLFHSYSNFEIQNPKPDPFAFYK